MDVGKSVFTGIRRLRRRPILLAALVLALFGAGAALGWMLLGSPEQRIDWQKIVVAQPMQIWHDQMRYRMNGTLTQRGTIEKASMAVLPEKFHDFGKVKRAESVSRTFEIWNQGEAPLVISSSYTTCGCITAELSASVIPAGKAGLLTVNFDSQNSLPGTRVLRGVILETNDPQHPQLELWIQADITR